MAGSQEHENYHDEEGLTLQERLEKESQLAVALGAFTGEWVIVKNSQVQGYGSTLREALDLKLDLKLEGYVFQVPEESDGAPFYLNAA